MSAILRIARLAALPVVAFALVHGAALAQGFPAKQVRIIVPFPPGGGADALARLMQPSLARLWGQPVIVENRPGASGTIGADLVASSAADGYTLLMSSTASLTEKNVRKFAPVTLVSASPYVITANPRLPAGNVKELIEYARDHPGKLSNLSSSSWRAASNESIRVRGAGIIICAAGLRTSTNTTS